MPLKMIFKSITTSCLVFVIIPYVYAQGPECREGYCDEVPCGTIKSCQGPNQYLKQSVCGCCPVCFTLLEEGECCPPILLGGPPALSACKEGLQCRDGICQRIYQ